MTKRVVQRRLGTGYRRPSSPHSSGDNPAAAQRFLEAVDHALAMLLDMPEIGAPRHHGGIEGLRMWRVPSFERHLIFYRPTVDGIEVIRVLHASRDLAAVLDEDTDE